MTEVTRRYLWGNALNPFRFPELGAMESEVVGSVASLLNRSQSERQAGAMTSGGTESILMAMLSYREQGRARGIEQPQILVPASAHPAYAKAAHYFGLELVRLPLDAAWRADVGAAHQLVTDRTVAVVASAFGYPYGIMDPVEELAALAASAGAGCHVDACIGAFVLPFLERLGVDVPPFDFRTAGVTTISADVHKYGYVPKGASVILHAADDWFERQGFLYDDWGAGLYGSAAIAGARPAAPVAVSWAVINYLGAQGYTSIVAGLMKVVSRVRSFFESAEGVEIVGDPVGPVMAVHSPQGLDLQSVAAWMQERGWFLNRNVDPPGLHLMLSPGHAAVIEEMLADLDEALQAVRAGWSSNQSEVRYS